MMAEFHSAALISGSWYRACFLTVTVTPEQQSHRLLLVTPLPTVTSQVCCFHTTNKTVFQWISCVAALRVAHRDDFRRAASLLHQDCILLVTLRDWHDISFRWPIIRQEMWYVQRKIHVSNQRPLSAHIHISITLLIEHTFRGHFSISGRWLDTFQPGVVVHLCYTVVGIKQYQQHAWLILIISMYLTNEVEPMIDYLLNHGDTVALLRLWWLWTINTEFDMWIQYHRGPYWWKGALSESSEWGLVGGASGVISKEDVGSGKIDVSQDQYWRAFGSTTV